MRGAALCVSLTNDYRNLDAAFLSPRQCERDGTKHRGTMVRRRFTMRRIMATAECPLEMRGVSAPSEWRPGRSCYEFEGETNCPN